VWRTLAGGGPSGDPGDSAHIAADTTILLIILIITVLARADSKLKKTHCAPPSAPAPQLRLDIDTWTWHGEIILETRAVVVSRALEAPGHRSCIYADDYVCPRQVEGVCMRSD